jgi:hypothetical protein
MNESELVEESSETLYRTGYKRGKSAYGIPGAILILQLQSPLREVSKRMEELMVENLVN